MKVIFCFIFIAAQYLSVAQSNYTPIINNNKFWLYQKFNSNDIPNVESAYALSIGKDTIVDNVSYNIINKYKLLGDHPCPPSERPCFEVSIPYSIFDKELYGFIREDTIEKKVYIKIVNNNIGCSSDEFLLFDFSLKIQDRMHDCLLGSIGGDDFNTIGTVDSISEQIIFNAPRRTLYSEGISSYIGLPVISTLELIEGIGFKSYGIILAENNLSQLFDFCNTSIGNCDLLSQIPENDYKNDLLIIPNPFSDHLTIKTDFSINSISIYNNAMQLLIKQSNSNFIQTETLTSGTYFMIVSLANGQKIKRKVLKF